MVSALDSGASGPVSSPGRGHCVVFLGKILYSHDDALSTQVYRWVLANLMPGVTLRWTSIPDRNRNRDKLGLVGHHWLECSLYLPRDC